MTFPLSKLTMALQTKPRWPRILLATFFAAQIQHYPVQAAPVMPSPEGRMIEIRARKYYSAGHIPEARRMIEPYCFKPDTSASMYCLLAETYIDDYMQNAEPKKIEAILQAAIKADPSYSLSYKDMAELCNLTANYKKAVEYGNKSLRCPKPYWYVYRQTVIAYTNLGQYDKALSDVNSFIKVSPPNEATLIMKAGILEKMKRYDDAVTVYRQAFARHPQDLTINSITRCYELNKKYPDAIKEISKLIKANPHDAEAVANRAKLYKANKEYPAALSDYSHALEIDPCARLYKARAEVYIILGKKDAADKDLALAKKEDASPF